MKFVPRPSQRAAALAMLRSPALAVFADMGTGKTAISLLTLGALKRKGLLGRAYIVAPLRVATEVWPKELERWDAFSKLRCEVLHGPKKQERLKQSDADILLVTVDGVKWLVDQNLAITPYDVLIVDESTKFKNWSTSRSTTMRKFSKRFARRYILTGTPVPEHYIDLFGQMYIVDHGASLGKGITKFREEYFIDRSREMNYSIWVPKPGATDIIDALVRPRSYRISAEVLSKELPPLTANPVWVTLPSDYDDELAAAPSASARTAMARHLAAGIMVDGTRRHDCKLRALDDLIEGLSGQHVIVFYNFHAEGDVLSKRYKAPMVDGRTPKKEAESLLRQWNAQQLPILLANPAGYSHGLNLQYGGHHACWFSLTDTGDVHEQANARLHRPGQTHPVIIHYILARGIGDPQLLDRLRAKSAQQAKFLDAMR